MSGTDADERDERRPSRVTDARTGVTTVLTSEVGAPVSLVGAPLRETHASFTLVTRVVRVIRAAKGVEGTPSRTTLVTSVKDA